MSTMTRTEHVDWAKARAYEYIDRGELADAIASFASDMAKHPDNSPLVGMMVATVGLGHVMNGDAHALRHFIEGFA